MTWGYARAGGDSSHVEHRLRNIKTLCVTNGAFAALSWEGEIVTWGLACEGGDSSFMQEEFKQGAEELYSTLYAFASKLKDGSVVSWGLRSFGGQGERPSSHCWCGDCVRQPVHVSGYSGW